MSNGIDMSAKRVSGLAPTGVHDAMYRQGSDGDGAVMQLLPGSSGIGSITDVVLLLERCLEAQQKSARDRRDAAEASQTKKEAETVSKIRDEADHAFQQALVSGFTSMGVGAVQITGAGLSLHSTSLQAQANEATGAAKTATEKARDAGEAAKNAAEQASRKAARLSEKASRVGAEGKAIASSAEALGGAGKLVDAPLGKNVKLDQADQASAKNAADALGRAARREDENAAEANELRKKTLDRLEQLLQAEQQTQLALIQRA